MSIVAKHARHRCAFGVLTVLITAVNLVCSCTQRTVQFQQFHETITLFDGVSLSGWKTIDPDDTSYWSVVDGMLTAGDGINVIPKNTYLQTIDEYGDFEFRCLFRLSGDHVTGFINSGIQYRSYVVDHDIVGYQADIGNGHWGDLYDEHRRELLVSGDLSTLQHVLNEDGWNSYVIRVKGDHHELYVNGVKTCDYIEDDPDIPSTGIIAFQLHSGGVAQLQVRDVTLTPL